MIQTVCELFSTAGVVERVGWVLVHSLWQFAAVAAVAAAATAVLHRSGAILRHSVLACGLVAMAVLPVVTWWAVDVAPAQSGFTVPASAALASSAAQPALVSQSPSVSSVPAAVFDGGASAAGGRGFDVEAVRRALAPWLGWCVAAWLVGVGCCAVRPLVGWAAWRRLRARGVAVPAEVGRMVDRACRRLGVARGVRALATGGIDVPAVAGWLSPVVLVPMALVTSLPAAQLEALIVHELAHVRRGDVLVNVLQAVLETLAFYHPAVWWLSGRLRVEREHCCDDLVLAATGGRAEYGRALVAVEMLRGRGAVLACGVADGSLVSRIRRLVTGVDPRSSVWPLPAFAVAGLAGLVVAVSLAARVQADDPLKDTNTITSLTPEEARKLVAEFKGDWLGLNGLTTLSPEAAATLANSESKLLFLNGLTTLSPEAFTALAGFKGEGLFLDGLTTLSPEAATVLARFKGLFLSLNGLTTLSPEAATALARFRSGEWAPVLARFLPEAAAAYAGGELSLDGLTTLSPEVATTLAGFKGERLSVRGLTTLSPEVATTLAGLKGGDLLLDGLTTLPPEAATALAGGQCRRLSLDGLTALSPEAATALAGFKGDRLSLRGLTTLSPEAATALAVFKGKSLSLDGLTTLSPEAVTALAGCKSDDLSLRGLTERSPEAAAAFAKLGRVLNVREPKTLSPEAAAALVKSARVNLSLDNLTTLSPESAAALAGFKGTELSLDNLTTLSPESAAALANSESKWLSLNGLTTLSPESAAALAGFKGEELSLRGLTTLSPEAAAALAGFKGPGAGGLRSAVLVLDGLTALSPAAAAALAGFKGEGLLLNGLTTLPSEAAAALAGFKGERLSLGGLTTLPPEAATALAGGQCRRLTLDGLTTLSPAAAAALAEYAGKIFISETAQEDFAARYPLAPDTARGHAAVFGGVLSGVTAFDSTDSVAIAKALAALKRPLKLPNLKKISPKTLAALIEKEDIEIPFVETLELIAEPDGSPTDDAVIPEGFKQRQRQQQEQREKELKMVEQCIEQLERQRRRE